MSESQFHNISGLFSYLSTFYFLQLFLTTCNGEEIGGGKNTKWRENTIFRNTNRGGSYGYSVVGTLGYGGILEGEGSMGLCLQYSLTLQDILLKYAK